MNTRDQVISYIEEQISENTTGAITATKLNAVLDYIVDRWFEDSEIKVTATGLTATDLKAALEELLSESTMTGSEIKAALEGISGAGNYLLSEFIGYANAWLGTTQVQSALDQTMPKVLWDWSEKYWPLGYRVIYDNKIYKKLNGDDEGGGSFDNPDISEDWIEVSRVATDSEIKAALEGISSAENYLLSQYIGYVNAWLGTTQVKSALDQAIPKALWDWSEKYWPLGYRVIYENKIYKKLNGDDESAESFDTPDISEDWFEVSANTIPASTVDFAAFVAGEQTLSNGYVLVDPSTSIVLQAYPAAVSPYAQIKWLVSSVPLDYSESFYGNEITLILASADDYTVACQLLTADGSIVASKTVGGFIGVQDVALFYVMFALADYDDEVLPGALVTFAGVTKTTGVDGTATFGNIAADSYSLAISLDGFSDYTDAAFEVSANIPSEEIELDLNAYIEDEEIIGTMLPGETATALYDFVPAGYEGATEVRWWVENSEGTVIVPSNTPKVRGEDDDYLLFEIPEAAAGHILKAEIKAYDVESNTNANMLKTPFMMVSELSLPVYFGYRTSEQTTLITEGIVLGTTDPSQHSEITPATNHEDFPDTIDVHWKDVFTAMDEFTEYTQWLAISEVTLASEYAYYQNIDYLPSLGAYDTKGVIESLTVDGNAYKIYKLNPTAPLNYRLSNSGI